MKNGILILGFDGLPRFFDQRTQFGFSLDVSRSALQALVMSLYDRRMNCQISPPVSKASS